VGRESDGRLCTLVRPADEQEPAVKAFVVHADSYIGKNVALWLKENNHEVAGSVGEDPGTKKPYYLSEAFHVPPVRTLKAHSLERPRSRHVRRMVRGPPAYASHRAATSLQGRKP
jgi:nucleoside-diphosphate-sugar epimerase